MVQAAIFVPCVFAQIGASWLSFLHQKINCFNTQSAACWKAVSTFSPLYHMQLNTGTNLLPKHPTFGERLWGHENGMHIDVDREIWG